MKKQTSFKRFVDKLRRLLGMRLSITLPKQRRAKRICARCEKAIRKHHKWQFNEQGRSEHRICDNPTSRIAGEIVPAAQQELLGPEAQE